MSAYLRPVVRGRKGHWRNGERGLEPIFLNVQIGEPANLRTGGQVTLLESAREVAHVLTAAISSGNGSTRLNWTSCPVIS